MVEIFGDWPLLRYLPLNIANGPVILAQNDSLSLSCAVINRAAPQRFLDQARRGGSAHSAKNLAAQPRYPVLAAERV